jgi:hypothetical protein
MPLAHQTPLSAVLVKGLVSGQKGPIRGRAEINRGIRPGRTRGMEGTLYGDVALEEGL